jgi:hypothetical protein
MDPNTTVTLYAEQLATSVTEQINAAILAGLSGKGFDTAETIAKLVVIFMVQVETMTNDQKKEFSGVMKSQLVLMALKMVINKSALPSSAKDAAIDYITKNGQMLIELFVYGANGINVAAKKCLASNKCCIAL